MNYTYRGRITLQDYQKWQATCGTIGLMKPIDQALIKIEIEELIESPDVYERPSKGKDNGSA